MHPSTRKIIPNYLFPLLALLAPLTMGVRACEDVQIGSICTDDDCAPSACSYNGHSYSEGDSFDAQDGCNTCSCASDGSVACTEIGCIDTCGGIAGLTCPSGQFCEYAASDSCGAADQTGTCSSIPEACTDDYTPVCGCDGVTYSNACNAMAASVSVHTEGECDTHDCTYNGKGYAAGDTFDASDGCNSCSCDADGNVLCTEIGCVQHCGGIAGLSCDANEYCNYSPDAQCGAADQTGMCHVAPETCDDSYMPVCGCDGLTYSNPCSAAASGVSVLSDGECTTTATSCGTRGAAQCASTEFCDFPTSANCGRADAPGSCRPTPALCTADYTPVCGCDGLTYSNTCNANAAGVSVDFNGECDAAHCEYSGTSYVAGDSFPSMDGCNTCTCSDNGLVACTERACATDFCGGIAGLGCPEGQFCNYPVETACGSGDQTGTCQVPPDACTQQYDPVCGCDGHDYGNACAASAAGISVLSTGVCN